MDSEECGICFCNLLGSTYELESWEVPIVFRLSVRNHCIFVSKNLPLLYQPTGRHTIIFSIYIGIWRPTISIDWIFFFKFVSRVNILPRFLLLGVVLIK